MPKPTDYDKTHLRNMAGIGTRIDRIFKKAAEEAAKIGVSIKAALPEDRLFSFNDYPETKKQIDRLMTALQESMETTIVNGVRSEWTLSNNKNNALASRVFGDNLGKLTKEQYRRYYSTNGNALDAFIKRKENGLTLSDRVWKYTDAFKNEIEFGLDLGIRSGENAASLARSLQEYLQYPDKLFRRVRDKHGILRLSKAAKAFHPGRGVYRSSHKNARRLAATETNIAYRTSDHLRWQQMDFVVGIEIKLSNNHTVNGMPLTDICDTLKGRYPKDFKFVGWHPHCRCHVVTILKTEEEMMRDTQRILNGEQPLKGSVNTVKSVPAAFKDWVEEHSDRIERGGNLPYFIKDNKAIVDKLIVQKLNPKILTEEEFLSYSRQMNISKEQWEELYNGEDVYIDSSWSREINANLSEEKIGEVVPDNFMDAGSYKQITTLDDVINKNQLKEDLLVYRKVSQQWLEREGISFKEGAIVHEYGYTSTSAVPGHNVIRKSRNVTLEIIAPKGSKAYITENIDESEIIFPRNSEFKVLSVKDNNGNPTIRLQLISKNNKKIRVAKTAEQKTAIQEAWNERRIAQIKNSITNGLLPQGCDKGLAALEQTAFNDRIKTLQGAAARHAARTDKQIADIKARWNAKLLRDAQTKKHANMVLQLAKSYNEVEFSELEKMIATKNLSGMASETQKVMASLKAMRAEERALEDYLHDVHGWHKTHSLAELKAAHNSVESTMDYYKTKFGADLATDSNLAKLKSELEYKIKFVENPGKYKAGLKPKATWQVEQDAYKKILSDVENHIELNQLNAEYMAMVGFKTTSKDFKNFMQKAKEAIDAGDVKKAHSYIASAQWKKKVLEHNRKGSGSSVKSTSAQFGSDAYTKKRKDAAMWAQDTKDADNKLRGKCGDVWRAASSDERDAIYGYTESYKNINEPLRGQTYYGSDAKKRQGLNRIPHIESIIDKSSYDFDMWLQRGDGMVALKKFGLSNWSNPTDADIMGLLGAEGVEGAFWSAGVAKGKGFSGDIIFNIYAPRGTKAMYCEPFSAYGYGSGSSWDGFAGQGSFGYESEILIQRGTKFKITKIEKSGGQWYIDVDIIEQHPVQFPYVGGYPFK